MPRRSIHRSIALLLTACSAWATDANAQPAAAASAPARSASAPARLDRVEITGTQSETEQRRQSTAGRIVVGREEIEKYGDDNIGDVLKRLPGVTQGGRPGRGGDIRMRGLGSGYTQILLNGERMPAGFSLESLTPEQVERIEILRAPTAEYGARAIAGTINIVLREALQKRFNDVKLGVSSQGGRAQPGFSWTRNDKLGDGPGNAYSFTLSSYRQNRWDDIDLRTTDVDQVTGLPTLLQHEAGANRTLREAVHFNGRLQLRTSPADQWTVTPFFVVSRGRTETESRLDSTLGSAPYASSQTSSTARYANARLNTQWQRRIDDATRLDMRLGGGGYESRSRGRRNEFDAAGAPSRVRDDDAKVDEHSWSLTTKLSHELAAEHSLVGGAEVDVAQRREHRTTLEGGRPLLVDFGDDVNASSTRTAAYLQDEWNPSKQWSAYAGLRWEGIVTRSRGAGDTIAHRSSVWTPLLHAVWKPDEKSRDQIRLSLTRSYRSPSLQSLIAKPSLSVRYPAPGDNLATSPDRIGNPSLKPELSRGIDLAFEHYLAAGGLVSVNLFHRDIRDLMRTVTELRTVSWSDTPRWVAQPRNIGNAVTQGIELEAKGRLSELIALAPPVSLRSNLSFFRSRVSGVPGPNNRLDQQPGGTGNLGADYRFAKTPLSLGGNVNFTPAYSVQQSTTQVFTTSIKRTVEAFVVWSFTPTTTLRIAAADLPPLDYRTTSSIDYTDPASRDLTRETAETRSKTRTIWTVRLEMKL